MSTYQGADTVIQGTIGVDDKLAAKEVVDMTPMLFHRYRNIDPMYQILSAINGQRTRANKGTNPDSIDPDKAKAHNYKINWLQKEHIQRWFFLTTAVGESGSAGATVTLIPAETSGGSADTSIFRVGQVVKVPQGTMSDTHTNVGVITTVNASTSIVVDPIGYDSNGITTDKKFTATSAGQKIHVLHDAAEEYSQSPAALAVQDTTEWNYIHFQRYPYIVGNIQMDVKQYSGPELDERREETFREIRISAEQAVMFGERYKIATGAGSNGAQFFMRGFWEYIRNGAGSNILTNWTGGFNEDDLDEYLVSGPCRAGYGGDTRLWFLSTELYLKLTSLMKAKVGNLPEKNIFGLTFEQYGVPGGKKVFLKEHHLLTDDYEGYGLMVDPSAARIRPYGTQGSIRLLENLQENDRAGRKDEWQTIFSMECMRVEPHGYQTP